jgi:MFS family permease
MLSKYRPVLAQPGAARLFASALLARFPQGMAPLAVLLLVRGATHSYAAAGLAVGAEALATAAAAPVLGRIVDQVGRRRVLAPLAGGQAVVYLLLVVAADAHAGAPVLVVLSGLGGALLPPVAPVVRVLLRDVFEDPAVRETAYSFEAVVQELVFVSGPLIVALLIAFTSAELAVALLGAVCMAGTALFLSSPIVRAADAVRARRDAAAPRTSALASPELRALLGPVALTGTALGAVEVGLPALAIHAGSRPASGLLLALWSLGSMVGGLWYGSRAWRSPLRRRYQMLLVLTVLLMAPLIAARSIAAAGVCSLIAGLTTAPTFSCQYALVGRSVSAGSETEAFTWVSAALIGGLAAGSAIGGAVIDPAGVSAPFVVGVTAMTLAALVTALSRLAPVPEAPRAQAAPDVCR